MTEAEFEFDAPNVCENLLLNQQDENTLNCTEAVDWFLKLHDHEAKVKEGASFSQQQMPSQTNDRGPSTTKKNKIGIRGAGLKREASKHSVPMITNDNNIGKKKQKVSINSKKFGSTVQNDVSAILKMHNAKHKRKSQYEPPRHSVRDVRRWERKHMKVWSDLTHEEREIANSEISAEKNINTT